MVLIKIGKMKIKVYTGKDFRIFKALEPLLSLKMFFKSIKALKTFSSHSIILLISTEEDFFLLIIRLRIKLVD